jgi:hypothetical protein
LSGYARLAGDSAIDFGSGQITSLAAGTHLGLVGNDAFIEDSTALGKNSALTGLASIGRRALFALHDGAAVSTTGALANDGSIRLDAGAGDGGSSLTVAGTLTNSGDLFIGNTTLSASDTVTAAAPDNNNTGIIYLTGSSDNQALLDVTTGIAEFETAGVFNGYIVQLAGDSAIEFTSGEITAIATGASLELVGNHAFLEDSTALGSNSALTGLASIGPRGALQLENGASVTTTGSLVNDGYIGIDDNSLPIGSHLTVAGTLTNTGTLDIGGGYLSASDSSVAARSFVNSGTVDLFAYGRNLATLDASGATTNNGSILITTDTEDLAGAVGGMGSFTLSNADLQFGSSVSSGQTINDQYHAALTLEEAQSFAATIKGFGTGDTIDAANFLKSGTTFNFVENSAGTGGTLTLHDAGLTANILMKGVYTNADFILAPDSGTGTLVKFV